MNKLKLEKKQGDVTDTTTTDVADRRTKNRAAEKWGSKVMAQGFCVLPSILLRAQRRLHINPTQLAILLQIIDHWWDVARKPHPSKKELALRLGISERQVQRHIAAMEDEGLLKREQRFGDHGGRMTNVYNLQGLVDKLAKIEPDFRQARNEARWKLQKAGSPGLRLRKSVGAQSDSTDQT